MRYRDIHTTQQYYVGKDADDTSAELWAAMEPKEQGIPDASS